LSGIAKNHRAPLLHLLPRLFRGAHRRWGYQQRKRILSIAISGHTANSPIISRYPFSSLDSHHSICKDAYAP